MDPRTMASNSSDGRPHQLRDESSCSICSHEVRAQA